jgi:thioredoxin reductase (NADPH)
MNMESKIHKLIVIGSGPAGLTAALYAARANLQPLVIEGNKPGGQLLGTTIVENWPGTASILGPTLMINMREQVQQAGAYFLGYDVARVDFSHSPFQIWTDKDQLLQAHSVIIATGASPHKLKVPGEEEYWGRGVTTCAVCDGALYRNKRVVIIGGGDTAMEDASFMARLTDKITIVQIKNALTASYAMQQKVLNNRSISIIYQHQVRAIFGNGTHVTGLEIENITDGTITRLDADVIFIAIGLSPNSGPFKNHIKMDSHGYIITEGTRTSVEGIFAAGDVQDYKYRQAITSAGSGCMAALDAQRYLELL